MGRQGSVTGGLFGKVAQGRESRVRVIRPKLPFWLKLRLSTVPGKQNTFKYFKKCMFWIERTKKRSKENIH